MKINLQTVHFKASKHLEKFVNEKVEKLFHQNKKIIHADVILYKGAEGNLKNQFCEIALSVPGKNLFVKKNDEQYEQSITDAVLALQKKMRRKKVQRITARNKSVQKLKKSNAD